MIHMPIPNPTSALPAPPGTFTTSVVTPDPPVVPLDPSVTDFVGAFITTVGAAVAFCPFTSVAAVVMPKIPPFLTATVACGTVEESSGIGNGPKYKFPSRPSAST